MESSGICTFEDGVTLRIRDSSDKKLLGFAVDEWRRAAYDSNDAHLSVARR
jgi:hypothetical protein